MMDKLMWSTALHGTFHINWPELSEYSVLIPMASDFQTLATK